MTDKCCFESLDTSLRDILSYCYTSGTVPPFGGMPIVLGGDFRQILPVVTEGTKCDDFDKDAAWIEIPPDMLIDNPPDPIRSIFDATYPYFERNYNNFNYIRERAIITPKNVTVAEINNYAIDLLPGHMMSYLSCDSICSTNDNAENLSLSYPPELLNSIEISGLPSHKLVLKKGMPVMLLRNLNQTNGLCNGTRLIITNLFEKIIEARVLTGTHMNQKVFLPRIVLTGSDIKWPFILRRRQFPIRACYGMTINKSQGQSLKQLHAQIPEYWFDFVEFNQLPQLEDDDRVLTENTISNTGMSTCVYINPDILELNNFRGNFNKPFHAPKIMNGPSAYYCLSPN
ncbi:PREDICTED: ATP-dependent DNA helicase PIF1-like [Fragaria vesca subsp. vesca]